jgi:hypothetical protein
MEKPEARETPDDAPRALVRDLRRALKERHRRGLGADRVKIEAKTGPEAAWLKCAIGSDARAHEIELFVRDVDDSGIDGGLGVLVDFLDGALEQFFEADRDAWLPLDFTGHPAGEHVVLARMELRDYAAERMADELLKDS